MTTTLGVPTGVAEAVRDRWPGRGRAWLAAVDSELRELCERFNAVPGRTYPARYGLVVSVSTPDRPLVMRSSADPDGTIQAAAAAVLADLGSGPAIHDIVRTATGTWTVMDMVSPGMSFSALPPSTGTLESLAAALRPMVSAPAPASELPSIQVWLEHRLADDNLTDLPPGRMPASPAERRAALGVLRDLADRPTRQLCHGDLSPGNVLDGGDGRFFLIDPRGMSGELAYDVAVLSLKAPQYGTPSEVARVLARALGIDAARVDAWHVVARAARV